ncbi:RluA family pseudouridine synthase [bacterium]|nr:RluA family pseudouridine synthase [bacterium]
MEERQEFIVEEDRVRLDKFLAKQAVALSRSQIQSLIKRGRVTVNGQVSKSSHRVVAGDKVRVLIPEREPLKVLPEDIPLHILYEDEELLIVNKPPGMVVHPAAGHYSGTLVNGLLFHCQNLSTINGPLRPGIVHRLDKDTSGTLMVAKTDEAHLNLVRQIKERRIKKKYLALVEGRLELDEGTIEAPLGRHILDRKRMAVRHQGGRFALTHYRVLERFKIATLLEITLATGRTHQIRVHLAYIGHPVVGDKTYGRKGLRFTHFRDNSLTGFKRETSLIDRQALHAQLLGFVHPSRKEYMQFTAPLPHDMKQLLHNLKESPFI